MFRSKHSRLPRMWFAFLGLLATSWLPAVVHACPMCFNGKDSNSDAFLYGSLFLMFVPVSSLGGLAYWAYRRIKAADNHAATDDAQLEASQPAVVLHLPDRR